MAEQSADHTIAQPEPGLTPRQIAFFQQYGYVKIPGLFDAREMEQFTSGFEDAFARHLNAEDSEVLMHIQNSPLHVAERPENRKERFILPNITEYSSLLAPLSRDPRITAIGRSLVGDQGQLICTDGSIYYCSTSWHYDFFNDPFEKTTLKFSLYLEPLRYDSGAIRFMPGTHMDNEYSRTLRRVFNFMGDESPEETFGVKPEDAPSVAVETDPGDLLVWDFKTMHATFHGKARRRQIGLNFGQPPEKR